jgi:hypothetical protein
LLPAALLLLLLLVVEGGGGKGRLTSADCGPALARGTPAQLDGSLRWVALLPLPLPLLPLPLPLLPLPPLLLARKEKRKALPPPAVGGQARPDALSACTLASPWGANRGSSPPTASSPLHPPPQAATRPEFMQACTLPASASCAWSPRNTQAGVARRWEGVAGVVAVRPVQGGGAVVRGARSWVTMGEVLVVVVEEAAAVLRRLRA